MWSLYAEFMYNTLLTGENKETITYDTWREIIQIALTISSKSYALILFELNQILNKFKDKRVVRIE